MAAIQAKQEEQPLEEPELVQCIWTGLVESIEWSARADQQEGLFIKELTVCAFFSPAEPELLQY